MRKFICLFLLLASCSTSSAQTPNELKCNQLLTVGKKVAARIDKLSAEQTAATDEIDAKIISVERKILIDLHSRLKAWFMARCSA